MKINRSQQNLMGDPKPNPQNVQGHPQANPQRRPISTIASPDLRAELPKLGSEKAGRVREFLNRKRDW